jgi:mycoketide-CoA synthase
VQLAEAETTVLTGKLGLDTRPWLADHVVLGRVLLPATVLVELAVKAAGQADCTHLDELTIESPLVLSEHAAVQLQVAVGAPDDAGRWPVTVHSRRHEGADRGPWTRHAAGFATPHGPGAVGNDLGERPARDADHDVWPPLGATAVDISDVYPRLAAKGLRYGPAFQGLRALWRCGADLYAEVGLPQELRLDTAGFAVHPALLDAVLHPLVLADDEVRLPFSWTDVTIRPTAATTLRVHLTPTEHGDVAITATDTAGRLMADVRALASRPAAALGAERASSGLEHLYQLSWIPAAPAEAAPGHRTWSVPGDDRLGLLGALTGAGVTIADTDAVADIQLLPQASRDGEPLIDAVHEALHELLAALQEWLADERHIDARLVIVTTGAVAARPGDQVTDLAAAAQWGLVRSAQIEHPDRFVLIDIDRSAASRAALPTALACDEPQLAVREGTVLAARLSAADAAGTLAVPPASPGWHLALARPGSPDGLSLAPDDSADEPLVPGQVRLVARAIGLNFHDVLFALGMIPDDGRPLGWEAAGVVAEVAPDVTAFVPGDRVMGLSTSGIGPFSIPDHRLLTAMPHGWSFAQAAAMPAAFLTAYYALVDLAAIQPGESLLVHAATGGVGTAAVQLARHLGVEVFATASPAKWDALRAMGFDEDHIASSRTLEFEQKFSGWSVDVVLNSLAGEYIDASVRLLGAGGRFVEMGKTDLRDQDRIGALAPGVAYRAFDLFDAGPARIGEMLAHLRALCEADVLRPLPVTAWDVRRAPEALRFFSQARHVGKVVLTIAAGLDPDGTVLITGATGELGGLVARHLAAARGVRRLLLLSRHGAEAAGAAELRTDLAALGAHADIVACDTSDRDALAAVLAAIPDKHPLTAVVHAAGILDDAMITTLTPEQIDDVLRAKADGAWHLHDLTSGCDLAAFILYSSVTATFGNAGQADYAAANAFLDGLSHLRQTSGLPAASLGWSLWSTAGGMTSHLDAVDRARLGRVWGAPLTAGEGIALFEACRELDQPVLLPVKLQTREPAPAAGEPVAALLRGILNPSARRAGASADAEQPAAWKARLAALPVATRRERLLEVVREYAAMILGHTSPDGIKGDQAFGELGFDSLTVVELRNRLTVKTGLRLPVTLLFRFPTPGTLADYLDSKLFVAVAS